MNETRFIDRLLAFLQAAPSPFHAVAGAADHLDRSGWTRLDEADAWTLARGTGYYVTRGGASLIAFRPGDAPLPESGIRMAGAHTDSPCLKVKPRPEIRRNGHVQLGVEVYGGALLNPWFDRDLSLAGRVSYLDDAGRVRSDLVDFVRPVAVIPNLAIHFDREANQKKSVNPQEELAPVLLLADEGAPFSLRDLLLAELGKHGPARTVLDFDLCFYDTQPPGRVGIAGDFITGARLDNLLSCYALLAGLTDAPPGVSALLVLNDHEEVGSLSASGAGGTFLKDVLRRILPHPEDRVRALARSFMVSADAAHGFNPNYAARYDPGHGPVLNRGPVIKVNAGQRYATSGETAARFRKIALDAGVPLQEFVMRSDLACGSTIGPLTAAGIGVPAVDAGVPVFAMHSIRETAGRKDAWGLYRVLKAHFSSSENFSTRQYS